MSTRKDEKVRALVHDLAARYVELESNRTSLITITNVIINDRAKNAIILFTTLPVEKENQVLDFLRRKRSDFQDYVRKNSAIGRVPLFDFKIDLGEKNRQNVDKLSNLQ